MAQFANHDARRTAPQLEPYHYLELSPPHNLRILKILGGDEDQELVCFLNQVTPEELKGVVNSPVIGPKGYEALSWTWGNAPCDQVLKIHDDRHHEPYQLMIMNNLHSALRALRHRTRSRYLWIDFICINQKNVQERNHQVERMNVIFGSAHNVCIWLGNANESSRLAFQFVKENMVQAYAFNKYCEDPQHLDQWVHLQQLMRRDWFTRRWILQEVALSRKATVHCGEYIMDWDQLAATISTVTELESTLDLLSGMARSRKSLNYEVDFFSAMPQLPAAQLVTVINQFFKRKVGQHMQRTSRLEDIVALTPTFECSEPRDTVFAVLALARDCQPTVNDIPHYLGNVMLTERQKFILRKVMKLLPTQGQEKQENYIVDYECPVVEVYADFVRFAIMKSEKDRALDIICRPFAQKYSGRQNIRGAQGEGSDDTVPLPTWIRSVDYLPFRKNFKPYYEQQCKEAKHFTLSRQLGDPFVSSREAPSYYSAADRKPVDIREIRFRKREGGHYSLFGQGFVLGLYTKPPRHRKVATWIGIG